MEKTIKQIAAEIGVSKQAVYKRAMGKLKTTLAPYTLTKNNCIYITDEGIAIIKTDFTENPCSTPLPYSVYTPERERTTYGANPYVQQKMSYTHTDYIRNIDGAHTEHFNQPTDLQAYSSADTVIPDRNNMHTEYIRNAAYTEQDGVHTEYTPDSNNDSPTNSSLTNTQTPTNRENNIDGVHTEQDGVHTEQIRSTASVYTEQSGAYTEQIRNTSGADTEQSGAHTDSQTELEQLKSALAEKNDDIHKKELELVRSTAEIEKLEEVVKQLKQRLGEKDTQIQEQKQIIQKTDDERKILTASLFRNNEIIEELMKLPLSKRIFGWKNVQKNLMSSRDDTSNDINNNTVDISQDDDPDDLS